MFFTLDKWDYKGDICDNTKCINTPLYRFDVQGLVSALCYECLCKLHKAIDKELKEEELK